MDVCGYFDMLPPQFHLVPEQCVTPVVRGIIIFPYLHIHSLALAGLVPIIRRFCNYAQCVVFKVDIFLNSSQLF